MAISAQMYDRRRWSLGSAKAEPKIPIAGLEFRGEAHGEL